MGKTKNYRLSDDEKRIHREAVEIRKKTDKQLIEYIEGERENIREALVAEYKAVFDEYIYPILIAWMKHSADARMISGSA